MPSITIEDLKQARNPACAWTEAAMLEAIAARFPSATSFDLQQLIESWLADESLSAATLYQCTVLTQVLMTRLGYVPRAAKAFWATAPRERLQTLRERVATEPPPSPPPTE